MLECRPRGTRSGCRGNAGQSSFEDHLVALFDPLRRGARRDRVRPVGGEMVVRRSPGTAGGRQAWCLGRSRITETVIGALAPPTWLQAVTVPLRTSRSWPMARVTLVPLDDTDQETASLAGPLELATSTDRKTAAARRKRRVRSSRCRVARDGAVGSRVGSSPAGVWRRDRRDRRAPERTAPRGSGRKSGIGPAGEKASRPGRCSVRQERVQVTPVASACSGLKPYCDSVAARLPAQSGLGPSESKPTALSAAP